MSIPLFRFNCRQLTWIGVVILASTIIQCKDPQKKKEPVDSETISEINHYLRYTQSDTSDTASQALSGVGWIYVESKNYDKAISLFNQALKRNNKNLNAYMGLGISYDAIKEYNYSIESFEQALKIKSDLYYAQYELGVLYLKTHQTKKMEKVLGLLVINQPRLADKLMDMIYK